MDRPAHWAIALAPWVALLVMLIWERGKARGRARLRQQEEEERRAAAQQLQPGDWIREAAAARSRASEARARKLLVRMLSPQQLDELESHGAFVVASPKRGHFVILPRTTFNVVHIQTGNLYCCNTEAFVPLSDLMLAQKLLLERDPDRFFAVANCRPEVFAGPWEQSLRKAIARKRGITILGGQWNLEPPERPGPGDRQDPGASAPIDWTIGEVREARRRNPFYIPPPVHGSIVNYDQSIS